MAIFKGFFALCKCVHAAFQARICLFALTLQCRINSKAKNKCFVHSLDVLFFFALFVTWLGCIGFRIFSST